jgi:hypothetical protein
LQEAAKPDAQTIVDKARKYAEDCETIEELAALKKEMMEKGQPYWSNETKAILFARHAVLTKLKEQEDELNSMESHGMDSYERDKKA